MLIKTASNMHTRNRNLQISRAPTKARSQEPAYSQALNQNKIDRHRSRSREPGRETAKRLWWMVLGVETGMPIAMFNGVKTRHTPVTGISNNATCVAKKQDTKRLYQMVKEICSNACAKTAAIKDKDGKLLESRTDIKNRWKEYFEKLYNETNPVDKTILQEMPPCNKQEHMEDILREEVESAVRSLKKRKSPGEDNITAEMIQAGEESSLEMMYTLCKRIYQKKSCPEDWGKAI